ncbi:MAG: pyridoxamine 5'-phosphate oxidase [Pseudomonadota bacterium]
MTDRTGIFAGEDPFAITRDWLDTAEKTEPNDANAIALATVDSDGMPNVRMVLLKDITNNHFIFYTNYDGIKGQELAASGKAAFVLHSKTQGRQIRVRGLVEQVAPEVSDAYYASRSLQSRLGAWASKQSEPLASRGKLMAEVARVTAIKGPNPDRPPHWGGFQITPLEIEFWANGAFRLHDRFRWSRKNTKDQWTICRLNP